MSKDFEQLLADATDEHGAVKETDVLNLLADAMTIEGDTAGQSAESDVPGVDVTETKPAEPAAAPAPAPAAPAPAPAAPAPAPAADTQADPDAIPEGKTPVVLAKDGVHTISYDKLVEARQKAADVAAENARLAAELAELRAKPAPAPAPAAPAAAPAPAADTETPLFGDYTDADLRKGVEKLLDAKVAEVRAEFEGKLKPVEVDRVAQAQREHLAAIYSVHADADSITVSQEFTAWEKSQPRVVQQAIASALDKGSAAEVVEVLDMYRAAHPSKAPAPAATPAAAPVAATPAAAKPTAAALADKAIAEAKTRTPTTLSDIPAGSQAITDESAAMEQANPMDLMDKLSNMTPDQIEAWTARHV